jgi:hypothetical protein
MGWNSMVSNSERERSKGRERGRIERSSPGVKTSLQGCQTVTVEAMTLVLFTAEAVMVPLSRMLMVYPLIPTASLEAKAVAEPVVVDASTVLLRIAEALTLPLKLAVLPLPSRPATDTMEFPEALPVTDVAVVE